MSNVVVLLPVYRNQGGLDRTLASVSAAVGNFDVIVVDDGSPIPVQVGREFRDGIRVLLVRLPRNGGIAIALNRGLSFAFQRGYDFVARLDAGDTIAPERFRLQAAFLDRNPGCGAVASAVDFVDEKGFVLFRYRSPMVHAGIVRRLRLENCLLHAASMIRLDAFRTTGPYSQDVPGAEDYELFLRISGKYTLACLPEVLTSVEYSTEGLSVRGRRRQQLTRLRLQVRYFDLLSVHAFIGVLRTVLAMVVPRAAVLRWKQAFLR